jgi:hypothetical protein
VNLLGGDNDLLSYTCCTVHWHYSLCSVIWQLVNAICQSAVNSLTDINGGTSNHDINDYKQCII